MAVRQSDPNDAERADFITCEQAAALTGKSARHWRRRAMAEEATARKLGRRSLVRVEGSPSGNGRPPWFLHRSFDARFTRCPDAAQREDRDREALLAQYPPAHVTLAYRRAHWLRAWRSACRYRRGSSATKRDLAAKTVADAKRAEGDDFAISVRTLEAWSKAYDAASPRGAIAGVEALIDRRCMTPSASVGDGATATRSPEAIEYFYRIFHCESAPGIKTCHECTLIEARKQRWAWPRCYSATRRWLTAYDNLSISMLLREGASDWSHVGMPFTDIDYSLIEVGQMAQADHHQCDFWVEHEGEQLRPWLTVLQDMRSRMVTGWHLGPTPHSDAILACYHAAFRKYACPKVIRQDNGRDFCSAVLTGMTKATRTALRAKHGRDWRKVLDRDRNLVECSDPKFRGIIEELGIRLIWAHPYAAYAKGVTERLFSTFEEQCGKTFATYCGRAAWKRPECLEAIRRGYTRDQKRRLKARYGREWIKQSVLRFVDTSAVATMDQARQAIGEWVELYHHTPHTGDAMDGRTPAEVWSTATSLRRAGDDELMFLMQSRGVYTVGPNGVTFRVGSGTVTYGGASPKLYPYTKRRVFVTVDPTDVGYCYAFTEDRKHFIGKIEANRRMSPLAAVDELRESQASVGRRRKIMRKAQRESPARTRDAAAELSAKRRERVAMLRTGTDDLACEATVVPVATGFESSAKAALATNRPAASRPRPSIDRELMDRAFAPPPRVEEPPRERNQDTLALLARPFFVGNPPQDADVDREEGTDAESATDALRLIAGHRHDGRTK